MKLLIAANQKHKADDEEYKIIRNFDEFRALTHDDISYITSMKLVDFMLSLSCVFWLVDYDLASFGHIDFVIATTDKTQSEELEICIAKYMNKYKRFKPPQYIPEVS